MALALSAGAAAAGPAPDFGQEMFAAPPDDRSDAPGPQWDRFHDADAAQLAIDDCLAAAQAQRLAPARCVGAVAEICLGYAANETTFGMTQCAAAEAEAWDQILNASYQTAMLRLDDGAAQALRAAQRAWIAFRDADCALPAELHRGGTIVRVLTASCLLEHTGRRAVALRAIASQER